MPMPKNAKSVLQTQDPYHTPGYGGYCPQFKYRIGQTFGKTTNALLTDRDVSTSGRLILTNIYPHVTEMDQINKQRENLMKTRTASWGDQKLLESMVPGYTGFIPRSEHYFGKRYAENCFNAVTDFENEQRKNNSHKLNMQLTGALQDGKMDNRQIKEEMTTLTTRAKMPLRRIAKDAAPYNSPHLIPAHEYCKSAYHMDDADTRKQFMSGYTGFVPRSRGLLGKGYPIITHQALNRFTQDLSKHKVNRSQPITVDRKDAIHCDTNQIYPMNSGIIPHYTGHVPGEKFRFGRTFGNSTVDPLNMSGFSSKMMPSVGSWNKGTTMQRASMETETMATNPVTTQLQQSTKRQVVFA